MATGTAFGAAQTAAETLRGVRRRIDRTRYRVQHWGLLLPLAAGQRILDVLLADVTPAPPKEVQRLLQARLHALLEQDLRNAEEGAYPRELLFELPLGDYLRSVPEALRDLPRVVRRIWRRAHKDLPGDVDLDRYPPYFRRNFHWQTDGYLSEHSARIYDVSVEFLFAGTAGVMRRMAIPPIVESLRDHKRPRVIDLGCGTGRFLLQLHRALPRASLYGLDLSPYYLQHARSVLRAVPDVSLIAENAEHVPIADETFDGATSVFLFHELPRSARRNVVREALRILKPGARLVISDSAQLSESGDLEEVLRRFQAKYHEPYFGDYIRCDLADLLTECGFCVEHTAPHFVSKVVVARKPSAG